MSFQAAAIVVLSAMTTAASLFIIAAGLTLIFGALRIINIAHGSFYMYGAYLVATIFAAPKGGALFWIGLIVAPLIVATIGAGCEVLLLRRVYDRDHLVQLLVTYALFLIMADLALRFWGSDSLSAPQPPVLGGSAAIGSISFPAYDLFVMGCAVAVGVAMWGLLGRTMIGWKIRAAVEDPETLAACGTNVKALFTGVFALGSLLAGFGGAVIAPLQAVGPGMGAAVIVSAFIVAVIGGLGSIAGAAIGAVIIGAFQAVGILYVPSWAPAFIFIAMIVVLAVRPVGLLGQSLEY
ncbi:MAG: branched-chain amino acid ABC transporter permease [Acetobacteraceae bacterium]